MSTRAPYGQAVKAAIHQLRHKLTTKAAAKMFGVDPQSIKHARTRKGIAHPFPRKDHAVRVARLLIAGKTDIVSAIKSSKASRATICCAVNRLGASLMDLRANRRISWNRNTYYFRYRTRNRTIFRALSPDITTARRMRDELEEELGLSR